MAFQHDRGRSNDAGAARAPAPPRRVGNPVLGLQRAAGNRATGQMLARRKGGAGRGTFEHSVRIGKLGPIQITDSNIGDWIAKKGGADDLTATTARGKHSDELKRLSEGKARVDTIEVQSVVGQNSWVVVTFKNARIRGYDASDKTESWKAVDFDAVDIKRTSIGKPRP